MRAAFSLVCIALKQAECLHSIRLVETHASNRLFEAEAPDSFPQKCEPLSARLMLLDREINKAKIN